MPALAVVLGATRVGATTALVNHHLRGKPLKHAIKTSEAQIVIVDKRLENTLCASLSPEDDRKGVLAYGGGQMDLLLAAAPATPYPPADVDIVDDFVFIYTSGTTALPKPCRVSHARAILVGAGFGHLIFEFDKSDKLYSVLPLYHSNALLLGAGSAIVCRVPMAIRESFSASAFWDDVHKYDATAILYIGELCRYLLNSPPHPREKLPNSESPLEMGFVPIFGRSSRIVLASGPFANSADLIRRIQFHQGDPTLGER